MTRHTKSRLSYLLVSIALALPTPSLAQTWKVFHIDAPHKFSPVGLRHEIDIQSIHKSGETAYLNTRVFSPYINEYTTSYEYEINCLDRIIEEIYYFDSKKNENVLFRQESGEWLSLNEASKGARSASLFGPEYSRDKDKYFEKIFTRGCSPVNN